MKIFETKYLDELVEDFSNYLKNTWALIFSTFYILFFIEHVENVNTPILIILLIMAIGAAFSSLFSILPNVKKIVFPFFKDVFSAVPVLLYRIFLLLANKEITFFKKEKKLAEVACGINKIEVIEEEVNNYKNVDQNILSNNYQYSNNKKKEFFSSIAFIKIIHYLNGLKLISPGFEFDSDNYNHSQDISRKLFFGLIKNAFGINIDSFRKRFNQDFYDLKFLREVVKKLENTEDFQIIEDTNITSQIEELIFVFKNNKLLKKSDLTKNQVYLLTLQLSQQHINPKSPIVYLDKNDIDDLKIIRRYLIDFEKR